MHKKSLADGSTQDLAFDASPCRVVGWAGDAPPQTPPCRRLHSRAFGTQLGSCSASITCFVVYQLYKRGATADCNLNKDCQIIILSNVNTPE